MNNLIAHTPPPWNEPVRTYAPGSPERAALRKRLQELRNQEIEVPAFIGGREIRTGNTITMHPPHDHRHVLGVAHQCGAAEIRQAIEAALQARHDWMRMPWQDRAAIFLKAAELLAGPWRDTLNAAAMLAHSKNVHQAEIDAACELIDFFRFNVHYMEQIYRDQPRSAPGTWNRMQYRPLEGFVFAVTPFNFVSIQGNLPTAPALMGNTVVWKPASSTLYTAYFTYKLLEEAGLPPGVINMIPGPGSLVGQHVFASPHFSGLHFTGSTATFQHMWRTIGQNIAGYRAYPRIVGETGGKDFILAHPSADTQAVATAIVRGGFEYQGQKCSAASRIYLPRSRWPEIERELLSQLGELKMGPPEDFTNFINAVIDRKAFESITAYIDEARQAPGVRVLAGGNYSDETGYFIEPTVLLVDDPQYRTMCEEIFGPVVSIYVYPDQKWDETLTLLDETSPYALTGALFARDRRVIAEATDRLVDNAGNFYINDKPTGAVVSQQPFGGARASGTNDKAGSYLNLIRWVSARAIKETFDPPKHFAYPFHQPDAADARSEAMEHASAERL
ncbi:L-glutamate gamma-semialdehyde dehydrogenase [Rhodocaloribacter litoris]|uniref:L-glutamate gamma-semialdehyde dehydrogenase n=1 Tax=Rhodocaloribacter litoris TaxID=2558931 RepID=UPI001422D5FD|nr:L-glutamate gamma-semialdehyde dehydrogenase [Rhodocaloribacter litoris]QXD15980.1 L-glutamate gamma-semialdehyde dehydrogenase [Rhodocaloribacter litoris]